MLLVDEASGEVAFIDHEYCAYGYRGFDVANHFCEYCGFECELACFPDKAAQVQFFEGYLREANGSTLHV